MYSLNYCFFFLFTVVSAERQSTRFQNAIGFIDFYLLTFFRYVLLGLGCVAYMATTGVSAIGQSSMQMDSADKRTASEVVSPPHRIGILRPRTSLSNPSISNESTVPKSPFFSTPKLSFAKSITSATAVPLLLAFQFGLPGRASNTITRVPAGALETIGLALGTHDGVKQT